MNKSTLFAPRGVWPRPDLLHARDCAPVRQSRRRKPQPPAAAPPERVPQPKILVIDRARDPAPPRSGRTSSARSRLHDQRRSPSSRPKSEGLPKEGAGAAAAGRDSGARREGPEDQGFPGQGGCLPAEGAGPPEPDPGRLYKAQRQVEQALGPILQGIMKERGANLMLDQQAVVLGTVDVDITRRRSSVSTRSCRPSRSSSSTPPPQIMRSSMRRSSNNSRRPARSAHASRSPWPIPLLSTIAGHSRWRRSARACRGRDRRPARIGAAEIADLATLEAPARSI